MFSCNRVFEDNSHYNDVFGPYGNAFVGAIEWLFTDEMSDGKPNEYYNFKDLQTPIFMSCVWAFIGFAKQPMAKLTFKDELNLLKPFKREYFVTYNKKTNTDDYSEVTSQYVQAVLWSAFIYCSFLSEKKPEDNVMENAAKILYDVLENELTDYIDQSFSGLLFDQIEPTLERFRELAPTDEEIAEQQKAKDIDDKSLDDYLADPVYKQCYDGIGDIFRYTQSPSGNEYTEEDYLNVYREAEKYVNEVLESKYPDIKIVGIQKRLQKVYSNKIINQDGIPLTLIEITPDRVYGRVIECVFCIVAFDKLKNKSKSVIKAFEAFRTTYENGDVSCSYLKEELWKLVTQRIPNEREKMSQCPPPAPAPASEPIEDKKQHDELQAKYDELQKKYEENKLMLEACQKEAIKDKPYNKVRIEVFCRLLENAGVDFEGFAIKAESSRFAEYVIGVSAAIVQNYLSNRKLSEKRHKKEIEEVNSSLRMIGAKIEL